MGDTTYTITYSLAKSEGKQKEFYTTSRTHYGWSSKERAHVERHAMAVARAFEASPEFTDVTLKVTRADEEIVSFEETANANASSSVNVPVPVSRPSDGKAR